MEIILKDKNGVVLHTSKKYCPEDIEVNIETQDLTVTPTTEVQNFTGLYDNVTVGAVENISSVIKVEENTLIINEAIVDGGILAL